MRGLRHYRYTIMVVHTPLQDLKPGFYNVVRHRATTSASNFDAVVYTSPEYDKAVRFMRIFDGMNRRHGHRLDLIGPDGRFASIVY